MERADLEIETSEQHKFFILYAIGITKMTDRRSTIGPNSLSNSKSVNPQPESSSVAKDVMGKIQEVPTIDVKPAVYYCLHWDQGL
eukprot:1152660-Pelagomonas_calceolata.AAC.1